MTSSSAGPQAPLPRLWGVRVLGGKLRESGRQRDLRYDFRYFQDFDQELTLPAGFKPAHLVVEVHSNRKDVTPLSQTFLWSVQTSP